MDIFGDLHDGVATSHFISKSELTGIKLITFLEETCHSLTQNVFKHFANSSE